MVALYNCFPRTYYCISQRHGMFDCHPLHDVDLGLYVHSHLQLENDQGHGIFHVHFLLFICTGLFGIWKQILWMSVIKGKKNMFCCMYVFQIGLDRRGRALNIVQIRPCALLNKNNDNALSLLFKMGNE